MITAEPGEVFEAVYDAGTSGLAGTLEVAINDNLNNILYGPTALNIVELIVDGTPNGSYRGLLTAPIAEGQYSILWSDDGSFAPGTGAEEDLVVEQTIFELPPLGGAISDSVLCSAWTTSDDVVDCCTLDGVLDATKMETAIVIASEELYEASGRRYAGICERTVYPEADDCACGFQVLSRGHVVRFGEGPLCGCRVKLAGTVRSITEIEIDGVVLDPSGYEVREQRWLERIDGSHWPCCQEPCAERTFSVTYSYGKAPPVAGQRAASQLACEIYKSCTNQECALPTGVTRVTRQGVTFERSFLSRDQNGIWRTGLALVDLFLNRMNPHGIPRRATFWSPSRRARYARG